MGNWDKQTNVGLLVPDGKGMAGYPIDQPVQKIKARNARESLRRGVQGPA